MVDVRGMAGVLVWVMAVWARGGVQGYVCLPASVMLNVFQGDEWREMKPKTDGEAVRKADRPPAASKMRG